MPTPARHPVRHRFTRLLLRGLIPVLARYLPVEELLSRPSRATVYRPLVVVWAAVVQALDRGSSDRAASYRVGQWLGVPVHVRSGALCKGRGRLPEAVVRDLAQAVAGGCRAVARGALRGRRWRVLDVSSLTVADTPANRAAFGLPPGVQPGCGYPVLRLGVLMDGRTGAVVAWSVGAGETAELVLAQPLLEELQPGDVLVADRHFGTYGFLCQVRQRGVDLIARQHHRRRNQRPGRSRDWDETWTRPDDLHELHQGLCAEPGQTVRCIWRERAERSTLKLVTTLAREDVSARVVARCYRDRWRIETQLNQLKTVQSADFLPAHSPATVAWAVAAQMLALNLLCAWRCDVARARRGDPWRLSLTGLRAGLLATVGRSGRPAQQRAWLLSCAGAEVVPERPGRAEPRRVKRRPKSHTYLTQPRELFHAALVGGR